MKVLTQLREEPEGFRNSCELLSHNFRNLAMLRHLQAHRRLRIQYQQGNEHILGSPDLALVRRSVKYEGSM